MFENPVHTVDCIKGQEKLRNIQNKRSISYAGAWTKFGFHEDSFSSGLRAAKHREPNLPIKSIDSTLSRGQPPTTGIVGHCLRTAIQLIQRVLDVWSTLISMRDGNTGSPLDALNGINFEPKRLEGVC